MKIRILKGLLVDIVFMYLLIGKKKGGKNKSVLLFFIVEDMGDLFEKFLKVIKVILEFKRYNYDFKKKMV